MASGVLFGPRGILESSFSWILGQAYNNQAEAYALLQGVQTASVDEVRQLNILGESKNTIRYLI
jgi:ribonuclease HI